MGLISPGGQNLDFLELRQVLSTYDGALRDPLWWPQERPVPMRVPRGQDYIRTAKAKGLKKSVIITRHALKNALNPVVTAISGWLAGLLAGAVFVEYIFDWKGMGVVIVDALDKYDFPVVMGSLLYVSIILIIINILCDIIYGWLDPRVSLN